MSFHDGLSFSLGAKPSLWMTIQTQLYLFYSTPTKVNMQSQATIGSYSAFDMRSQLQAEPYDWPHDKSLAPKTTALLVIDMQRDCT